MMEDTAYRAIAIVGAGAVLPDAPDVPTFWENVKQGRYSVSEVDKERWDPALYYDADAGVPDKTYSKIGGWVRDYPWEPLKWRLAVPPRVVDAMDVAQKWAIACTREALEDYGYPQRPLDLERTAVILGNAMAGEKHYLTALRIYFPEYARELEQSGSFATLPEALRRDIKRELHARMAKHLPDVTEDSMPGELANCIAGRIANIYNFHGPNYIVDAACASAMAAISSAVEGLVQNDYDGVITGGIDRNMGASTFVKFCKIGALSATGTRPYADGADGFVMGEGAAIFLLKRLADAERDGDKIYAVLRGIGGSSDGKGKGITAPNPIGQRLAIGRGWQNAGLSLATATYVEGHGTSTRVGDVVEVQSLVEMLSGCDVPAASVALGSVKSNIGHLKGAAGAAGFLKTILALRDKVLPPSINCQHRNPDIDFAHSPVRVNTELAPWTVPADTVRRAGLSAFGFGGTNFHAVLEEYVPHRLDGNRKRSVAVPDFANSALEPIMQAKDGPRSSTPNGKEPLRGALVIGAASEAPLLERLRAVKAEADAGRAPAAAAPSQADLRAPERLAIDYADSADLALKATQALKGMSVNQAALWKALRAQGIFRGHGPAPKAAFLYTGQGSQYINMLRDLRAIEPIVAETFAEADRVMSPLLGKPLTDFIFIDSTDAAAVAKAEDDLRQTAITQPAVLATDMALTRLLAAYGVKPDFTMGHSLGEYGALIASGAIPFEDALEAVSARGQEMTRVSLKDNGRMVAVFAPLTEIERILKKIEGYIVVANINSQNQAVVGGASRAVELAMDAFQQAGYEVAALPVSHAFHTSIVAPASEPLRKVLQRLRLQSPHVPVIANVDGEFYPAGADVVPRMLDILAQQVASPVQFIKGLNTLYKAGARVFVEVGPKKALQGFAEDVLGNRGDVLSLFTNHPKFGELVSFNQALCGLYAAGLGRGTSEKLAAEPAKPAPAAETSQIQTESSVASGDIAALPRNGDRYLELGRMFADVLERGWQLYGQPDHGHESPVAITGAALGLPGTAHIFDDENVGRILRGEQFIDAIPHRLRHAMLGKHITRLVKSEKGEPSFETIGSVSEVIKLAGRGGAFDLESEFGVTAERVAALDRATQLAMAAGVDALRDAGIPLVMRYKTTTRNTQLPDRWALPDPLRDETGVIFASAFPGYDSFADEMSRYYADRNRHEQLAALESLRERLAEINGDSALKLEIERRAEELRAAIDKQRYVFDRRFLFRVLPMGHSQFAEYIGARGPNTAINAACASTTQAVGLAQEWIRGGKCRRVVVLSADDVTSDHMMEWFGAGFLATGAASTDEVVEEAALPFDRRRHGMIVGMGAAALVVESADAARERGLSPICEVLSAVTANSAYHGTRLDLQHISQVMESLISEAEQRHGIRRQEIAPRTVFVSHETYTPARGGSASAEIFALRNVFGDAAGRIVIANTKGFTGHAMATGIEDVVAVKALETGCVPPVANFKEVDPELGPLNLSKGGMYPIDYALRLGAGFGSQISMTLVRWVPTREGVRRHANALGYAYRIIDSTAWNEWLNRMTGYPAAELEIVRRTLRVRDRGPAAQAIRDAEPAKATVAPVAVEAPAMSVAELGRKAAPAVTMEPETRTKGPAFLSAAVAAPQLRQSVKDRVLAVVAEKTGYPVDMLELDLDLEADLGVDTVKQAEVFAAIREAYSIPRDEKLKLRDFPTLAHVIRFVEERRPDLHSGTPVAEDVAEPQHAKSPIAAAQPENAKPTPANAAGLAVDDVQERVLALVVEKTGYPRDMLDLDLDLEADLGIDTVKQAEMFAAIRELYNIPRDDNRKLRDYPTLGHVIRFVREKRPGPAPVVPASAAEAKPVSATQKPTATTDDAIRERILQIVAEKTGYPQEMLDLDLDLEADLGIDTVKQAEMFAAVRAAYGIPRDENLKLRDFPTLASVIKFARERQQTPASTVRSSSAVVSISKAESRPEPTAKPPARPAPASLDAANRIPRRVPVAVLRPPLDICKSTGVTLGSGSRVVLFPDKGGAGEALASQLRAIGVQVLSYEGLPEPEALADRLKTWLAAGPIHGVYWLPALDCEGDICKLETAHWQHAVKLRLKLLYAAMRTLYGHIATPGTFLISATRLGGQHGYDEAGAIAPLGGAVAGFTKTYKRERPGALVKVVDFSPECNSQELATYLLQETLSDPGAVEVGHKQNLRWTISLEEQPAEDGQPGLALGKDTVFLITGAAGSIVSAITADLAAASSGTFYLLDVAPEPDPDNADLKRFANDKEALKRDLYNRIQARGERATPALVEKELAGLERAQAAVNAIESVRAAGGAAHYFPVDLTNARAVAKVMDEVRSRSGRIDVLLHAAGIERSHALPDKDDGEFDLVFGVKADGWFNLLHAIGDMPVGAAVAFSSIAGRFGNPGQTDYSSANDLLCKITSNFRSSRPATRAIAIDWTAWSGMGMATRGSIPKVMEAAGIDMLPPEAGIPLVRRELISGATRGEVVIGQRLGVLLKEWDATGGLDTNKTQATPGVKAPAHGPMAGRVVCTGQHSGLSIETTLDPATQPFLRDHQIEGTPLLPGVMGIEAFAEAALHLLPGWQVAAMENVNFVAPVKFYRNEPRTLNLNAVIRSQGDGLMAECKLTARRTLPNQPEPQVTTHFTGRVYLAKSLPQAITQQRLAPLEGPVIAAADIYRVFFHGPAYQVVSRAWWDGARMVTQFAENLPANHDPADLPTAISPRLIELCFQCVGLWELGTQGRFGLPQHVQEIRFFRAPDGPETLLYAFLIPKPGETVCDVEVADTAGNLYVQVKGYRTVPAAARIDADGVRALQAYMSLQRAAA